MAAEKKQEDIKKSAALVEEISGLFLIAFSIFFFIALFSHSPADPSLSSYSSVEKPVNNLAGIIGAYVSDVSIQFFGFSSYIVPITIAISGLFLLIKKRLHIKELRTISGLVLLLASTSALFSILHSRGVDIPEDGLGVLGEATSSALLKYLNYAGAYIVAYLAIILSFILTTGISVVTLFRVVTQKVIFLFRKTIRAMKSFYTKRRERRKRLHETKELLKEEKSKQAGSPTIVIDRKDKTKESKPKEVQETLPFLDLVKPKEGSLLPPVSLLDEIEKEEKGIDKDSILMNSRILVKKLKDFGVEGEVKEVHPGPVITMYEFVPAPGVKVNKIVNLVDDLTMALSAISIRIVAPIPGKAVVGIEIPNSTRETVYFKELLTSKEYIQSKSKLSIALGKDIAGDSVIADLTKMPHLLVAGATGAGKSVSVNSMICSILYKAAPEDVRFIMVDPKMLELSVYDGIPHLLLPVVTDPKKAALALRWAVDEMERRYRLLADTGVKNILSFNRLVEKNPLFTRTDEDGEQEEVELEKLPYLVIIIDELADLMMVASRDVEECITRLAQMARASGIHMILATQRPSVDVITGIIKANFPSRISFQVSSKTDSRTILDCNGAESLLGSGDMLFLRPGTSKIQRVHGAYLSEAETHRIVGFLKKTGAKPVYDETILKPKVEASEDESDDDFDEKYDEAVAIVAKAETASISMIQRRMRIGYNRAARIIEKMEEEGVVGPSDGTSKGREVLISNL